MEQFALRTQVPRLYGESFLDEIQGDFLPISGGTMQGDINMDGNKITNLGQTNIVGTDAVTYGTVLSLLASVKTQPSFAIATRTGVTSFLAGGLNILALPGIFNQDPQQQIPTNWNRFDNGISVDGYYLGSNNVAGFPLTVALVARMIITISGSTGAITMQTTDRQGTVLGTVSQNIPENITDPIDLSLSLPPPETLYTFEDIVVSVYISVNDACTVTHEILQIHFDFTY